VGHVDLERRVADRRGGRRAKQRRCYDVWDPTKGPFAPQWTANLSPVYGPVPDGGAPFGMVSKDDRGTDTVTTIGALTTNNLGSAVTLVPRFGV
jgi:hypothetical protein